MLQTSHSKPLTALFSLSSILEMPHSTEMQFWPIYIMAWRRISKHFAYTITEYCPKLGLIRTLSDPPDDFFHNPSFVVIVSIKINTLKISLCKIV